MDRPQEDVPPTTETENDLLFPTVHNIYNGKVNVPPSNDSDESSIVTRSPSTKRSKINRLVYAKLHRNSHANTTIDKLKGKYEPNADKQPDENAEEAKPDEEKLEGTLNVKLKKETVEQLKNKYSPASFGYPRALSKSPKKVQFSPDGTTKIPVPKPRSSVAKPPEQKPEPEPEEIIVEQVHVKLIAPEEPTRIYASTSTLNSTVDSAVIKDENSNHIEKCHEEIEFAEPEEKHFVVRASSSEDSVVQVENTLSEFVMEGKPKEKKRSGSFRKILSGKLFGKDKKTKKPETVDVAQNEPSAFNRKAVQRHTIGGSYETHNRNENRQTDNDKRNLAAEELFAQMHINKFNDIRNNFARYNTRPNFPGEEYVCMDNAGVYRNQQEIPKPLYSNSSSVDKFIDTSSSSSTLESEKQHNTYENSLIAQAEMRKVQENNTKRSESFRSNKNLERFTASPPRAHETYQNLQLVKPKAVIPINSERALPNPYQNEDVVLREKNGDTNLNRNDSKSLPEKPPNVHTYFDETYGTVFDSIESKRVSPTVRRMTSPTASTSSSPRSPSLEGTKLRLPSNRERVELQPRIKSPIPQTKVSTDKIIATELLKSARSPTPPRKSSHQRLEIPIDYPSKDETFENGLASHSTPLRSKPPVSPKKPTVEECVEAGEWHRKARELDQYPSLQKPAVVANTVLHTDANHFASPLATQDVYHSTSPVNQRYSSSSAKLSPEKHEIRQQVEAYCWKELKKLKEKEERDFYYYQLQTYGYADDAVLSRRSRSLTPNPQRGGRRSLSLPRDVQPVRLTHQQQQQPIPEGRTLLPLQRSSQPPMYAHLQQQFVRNSPERRTIGPIGGKSAYEHQKPIFNRGSLSNHDFVENSSSLKKVSFNQKQDNWPTKNGYTQSPPQRRLEKERSSEEVFLDPQQEPSRRPQMKLEEVYYQKTVMNKGLYGHRNPLYQNEPVYLPKQVRVSNKVCDIYGQIHDDNGSVKTGVVYGQLQSPVLRSPNFVRGSRLTASANDMYKRYQGADPRYRSDVVFDPIYETNYSRYNSIQAAPNRPLPPVPGEGCSSFLPRRQRSLPFDGDAVRARGK